MTSQEFVTLVRAMGVDETVMQKDISFVLRRLSTCLPELRTKDNMRFTDQSDFRAGLQELADEFRRAIGCTAGCRRRVTYGGAVLPTLLS